MSNKQTPKEEAIEFLQNVIANMRKHGYKKLKDESPEYKHKREAHNKTLKRWRFMLKAVKGYNDEL